MDYKASRLISAASLGYGVFAAVKPRHLADNMKAPQDTVDIFDKVAKSFAARDVPVSLAGILGSTSAVEASMKVRIFSDLADCVALGVAAPDAEVRRKVMGVTGGWAVLNILALAYDRRRQG